MTTTDPPCGDEDAFIKVDARNFAFYWRCLSCHEDDTAWITSADARRAGEDHSCLDYLGQETG